MAAFTGGHFTNRQAVTQKMTQTAKTASAGVSVELENIWKVFGARADEAMAAITAEGLSKQQVLERYDAVVGVADVSIDVRPGEIFCVMGLSGSGKSTLVRHVNRLLEPTYGKVTVGGRDVLALRPQELQQFRNEKIAMVFQNFALMPHRSVLDNIALPLEIRAVNKNRRLEQAEKMLSLVELDGWGHKFAHELSGGMQQRVGLARALAADPDVLLMDEPFSALDPLIRRQLQDEFINLSKVMKKTTLFITHDLDEAVRVGERIAIMRDGRIVQTGTPEQIVMNPADDYVADFVAGISRLKVVKAAAVMRPPAGDIAADALDRMPVVTADESLTAIIRLAMQHEQPILVKKAGRPAGIISVNDIMRVVIEGAETS